MKLTSLDFLVFLQCKLIKGTNNKKGQIKYKLTAKGKRTLGEIK